MSALLWNEDECQRVRDIYNLTLLNIDLNIKGWSFPYKGGFTVTGLRWRRYWRETKRLIVDHIEESPLDSAEGCYEWVRFCEGAARFYADRGEPDLQEVFQNWIDLLPAS